MNKIVKNFLLLIAMIVAGVSVHFILNLAVAFIIDPLVFKSKSMGWFWFTTMLIPPLIAMVSAIFAGYLFYRLSSIQNKPAKLIVTVVVLIPIFFLGQIQHYFFIKSAEATNQTPKVGQSLSPQFDENNIMKLTDMDDNIRDFGIYQNWLCYTYTFDDLNSTAAIFDLDTFQYVAVGQFKDLSPDHKTACRLQKPNRLQPRRQYNANNGYTIQLNQNSQTEIYDPSGKLIRTISKFIGWSNAPVIVGDNIIYEDGIKIHIYNYVTEADKTISPGGSVATIDMNEKYAGWKVGGSDKEHFYISGQIYLYKK